MPTLPVRIRYTDLISGLSKAIDLISPMLEYHHTQVALITSMFCAALGYDAKRTRDLVVAAALHDIGGLTLQDRLDVLNFENKHPHQHAENGFLLLKDIPELRNSAGLIRFHHVPWENGKGKQFRGYEVPYDSQVLYLADRIAVLINKNQEILGQVPDIIKNIVSHSGDLFDPALVSEFEKIASREYFWLELSNSNLDVLLREYQNEADDYLKPEDLLLISGLFSHIVDFRSHFTANHSSGVAAVSQALAIATGQPDADVELIGVAGYLHDLGKLAVPTEILEKPGKLTAEEFNIIRKHPYYTHFMLRKIGLPDDFIHWAAFHHENLSGNGYPFHVSNRQISHPARILAVADIFTALTEDRPYRKGMNMTETISVLQKFVEAEKLDSDIVAILGSAIEDIDKQRIHAQSAASESYHSFRQQMV